MKNSKLQGKEWLNLPLSRQRRTKSGKRTNHSRPRPNLFLRSSNQALRRKKTIPTTNT